MGCFAMQKHRKYELCHFLAPAEQPEMLNKNVMYRHLRIFVVQRSRMKFFGKRRIQTVPSRASRWTRIRGCRLMRP